MAALFAHGSVHQFPYDVEVPEWIAWVPMLVLILAIGIFPNLVFHVTDGQATALSDWIVAAGR